MFVNLRAACDTSWHRGLTCKLLRLLPDKHVVWMILELICDRSVTLTTGASNQSRLRRLRNGVPQGLVLAPSFLISVYTIFPPQPPGSMLIPMIWLCFIHLGTERGYGNGVPSEKSGGSQEGMPNCILLTLKGTNNNRHHFD